MDLVCPGVHADAAGPDDVRLRIEEAAVAREDVIPEPGLPLRGNPTEVAGDESGRQRADRLRPHDLARRREVQRPVEVRRGLRCLRVVVDVLREPEAPAVHERAADLRVGFTDASSLGRILQRLENRRGPAQRWNGHLGDQLVPVVADDEEGVVGCVVGEGRAAPLEAAAPGVGRQRGMKCRASTSVDGWTRRGGACPTTPVGTTVPTATAATTTITLKPRMFTAAARQRGRRTIRVASGSISIRSFTVMAGFSQAIVAPRAAWCPGAPGAIGPAYHRPGAVGVT